MVPRRIVPAHFEVDVQTLGFGVTRRRQEPETDVTREYGETLQAWVDGRRRHYDGLKEALGEEALRDKIAEGEETLRKLDEGLLRRSFLTARRPG